MTLSPFELRLLRVRLLLARLASNPYHETCDVLDRYLSPNDTDVIDKSALLNVTLKGGNKYEL